MGIHFVLQLPKTCFICKFSFRNSIINCQIGVASLFSLSLQTFSLGVFLSICVCEPLQARRLKEWASGKRQPPGKSQTGYLLPCGEGWPLCQMRGVQGCPPNATGLTDLFEELHVTHVGKEKIPRVTAVGWSSYGQFGWPPMLS